MLMGAHNRAIDEDIFKVGIIHHSIEKAVKYSIATPPVKANVDRVPLAEMLRQGPPMRTGSREPENGLHKLAVVAACAPGICRFARQVRGHLDPNAITQFLSAKSCWPPSQ